MKPAAAPAESIALQLRRAFDDSFAAAPCADAQPGEDFLAIRVGEHPHLLALRELAGLHADRELVPVPSASPALLGIASFREIVAPVFDLRVLLGYAGGAAPRWLVLARGTPLCGFAFDHCAGLQRVAVGALLPGAGPGQERGAIRGIVAGEPARPVIDLAALLAGIRGGG